MTKQNFGLVGSAKEQLVKRFLARRDSHTEAAGAVLRSTANFAQIPDKFCRFDKMPGYEKVALPQAAARKLGIDFVKVDCRDPYRRAVLDNFRLEYSCGRTPNPCVLCNSLIKFGVLPSAAEKQGIKFDKFATGHYARVEFDEKSGKYLLKKAKDLSRDQSYFLHRLTQRQLSRVLFPLGEMTKPEIREIARKAGLEVADKEDSQDFYCGDYNDLLNFPSKPGDIVTLDGQAVARHEGLWHYTIGKRKGLGISGFKTPMYVVRLDAAKNQVVIGPKDALYSQKLTADKVSWVAGEAPAQLKPVATGASALTATFTCPQAHCPAKAIRSTLPPSHEGQTFEHHDILFVFQQCAMQRRDRLGRIAVLEYVQRHILDQQQLEPIKQFRSARLFLQPRRRRHLRTHGRDP